MADQSDVETALVSTIAGAIYPQTNLAPSIFGATCRVYRGWPTSAALNADLAAGVVNVTVFAEAAIHQNTTRYPDAAEIISNNVPTLTIAVNGSTATVAGKVQPGQVAGLLVDNLAAVHRVQTGDTLELIAATLATYLRTHRLALVSGASVTLPDAKAVIARVVSDQTIQRETRRQRQGFRITAWCPTPALRDLVVSTIDQSLSGTRWLPLAEGTVAYLRGMASKVFDQSQSVNLYRRDLVYVAEYATTITTVVPTMIFGDLGFTPADAGSVYSLLA